MYITSSAYVNKMPLASSLNIFGQTTAKDVEFDLTRKISSNKIFKPSLVKDTSDSGKVQWIISPKMETPVLDFSKQSFVINSGAYWGSGSDGFGRGMWSGYGSIPSNKSGIFLELRDSFPVKNPLTVATTGSLLDQIGFKSERKKIGEIAESKEISEAVICIPYLESPLFGITTNVNGYNFVKIDRANFGVQRQNIENGDSAIKIGDLNSKNEFKETSISKMIESMGKYVVPPHFNFMTYPDIPPFAMYIFEFKHLLDQEDLSDIWQGLMPKIATTAELDEVEIKHESGQFEFFHGKELPNNLRWMTFKIKKKAEKDYFSVTEDSNDDDRFKFDFKVGRKNPEYSFNWPYDFFSLVEFCKVDLSFEYGPKDIVEKISPSTAASLVRASRPKKTTNKGKKSKLDLR